MDKPPFADPDAMLLTAAIDFAVPPQANEQQIEDKINEIIHESTTTTIRKVEKLWEDHFNTPPDPNVERRVIQKVDALKQYGKRYLDNPSQANLRLYEDKAEKIAWDIRSFIKYAQHKQEFPDKPHRQVQDVAITQKQIMDKIEIEIPLKCQCGCSKCITILVIYWLVAPRRNRNTINLLASNRCH